MCDYISVVLTDASASSSRLWGLWGQRQGFAHPCSPTDGHRTWGAVAVCRHRSSEWIVSVLCHWQLSSDSESTPHPHSYLKHVPKCLVSNLQENHHTEGTCCPDLEVNMLMSAAGSPGKFEQICEEVEVTSVHSQLRFLSPLLPFWNVVPSSFLPCSLYFLLPRCFIFCSLTES